MKRAPAWTKVARPRGTAKRPHVVSGVYPYSLGTSAFRQKRAPTPVELVASYRAMTYSYANRNARAVASQNLRLYGATRRGQKGPSWESRTLRPSEVKALAAIDPQNAKAVAGAQRVDEIVDHPVLDLLNYVNPWMDRYQLFELTQLYKEIVGYEMWTFATGAFGRITELWPLPAWMVYPVPDYAGTDVVLNYVFTAGGGQTILERDEVLYFRTNNLFDPYTQGFSPLRAAYELAEIWDKRTDYEDSVLTNRARPDALLIPKDDLISPEEIQRANQEFKQQFGLSGAGGLWIPPGGLTFQAVSYPPKDMGELALSKETKINLASVFDIPAELVDQQAPRAAKDAALLDYARNGVKPRCMRLQECLNSNFVNRFDERLFLAYDDPVPADVKAQTEKHGKLVAGGIETRNEARAEFGLPPLEGGDTLLVAANLIPLQHAASGDPRLIEPEGAARPEEIPDEDRTPSKEDGDDDHDADVDESDDEPFEEGDDVASAKGLGDEYRFPFDEDGDIPSAERILRRALRDAGYSLAEHENETLAGVERLRLVRSVSTVAERWLRREATKVLKAAGVKGIAADMIDKVNGFFRRAGRFVRNAVTAGALAILGPGPLSDEERRAAEQQAFRQLSFLERFRDETAGGQKPIDRRFRQRAGLYGQAVRGTAQNVMRQTVQAIVVEEMRLHYKELEAHHPCQTCIGVSGYWAPVGELPEIGDSECQAMCDCYFVYRGLDNEEFTAGRPRLSAQGRGPLYEPVFGER